MNHNWTFDANGSQPLLPRIVLTGPPCSGKTTALQWLKRDFPDKIVSFPEVSSIISNQFGYRSEKCSSREEFEKFHEAIHYMQAFLESRVEKQVFEQGGRGKVLVVDRGSLDDAAYLTGGIKQLEEMTKTNREYEYNKYALVIFLELAPRVIYEKKGGNNPGRYETYEQAKEVEKRTLEAWSGHPNLKFMRARRLFKFKYQEIKSEVQKFLAGFGGSHG